MTDVSGHFVTDILGPNLDRSFAIAGKGGHFVWAHAEVDGNLPAISSRSDDWSRHQRE